MPGDPIVFLELALLVLGSFIFALSGYKALRLGKVLVGDVYKRRASWNAVFAALCIPLQLAIVPFLSGTSLPPLVSGPLILFIIVANGVGFIFLDSAISVARQMDFFARDSLAWGRARWPAYAVFFIGMFGGLFGPQPSVVAYVCSSILWPGSWGYAAAVLGFSSARVVDSAMRKYAKWIGLFALAVAVGFLLPGMNTAVILLFLAVASVFFYKATSSLALTGRLAKERSP